MSQHDVITFGSVREGEKTISGTTYPMSGYGWSCSCHAAGFGYQSEDEADEWAAKHVETHRSTRWGVVGG